MTFLPLGVSTTLYVFVSLNDCNSEIKAFFHSGASSLSASSIVTASKGGAGTWTELDSFRCTAFNPATSCITESENTVLLGTLPDLVGLNIVSARRGALAPGPVAVLLNRLIRELLNRPVREPVVGGRASCSWASRSSASCSWVFLNSVFPGLVPLSGKLRVIGAGAGLLVCVIWDVSWDVFWGPGIGTTASSVISGSLGNRYSLNLTSVDKSSLLVLVFSSLQIVFPFIPTNICWSRIFGSYVDECPRVLIGCAAQPKILRDLRSGLCLK